VVVGWWWWWRWWWRRHGGTWPVSVADPFPLSLLVPCQISLRGRREMAWRIATGSGRLVRVTGLGRPPVEVGTAWGGRRGRRGRRGRGGSRRRRRRYRGRGSWYRGWWRRVDSELGIELRREIAGVKICKVGWIGDRLEERIFAGDNLGFYALQQRELMACARHAWQHVTLSFHQRASRVPTKIPEAATLLFIGSPACFRCEQWPSSASILALFTARFVVVVVVVVCAQLTPAQIGVARRRGVDIITNEVSNRATPCVCLFSLFSHHSPFSQIPHRLWSQAACHWRASKDPGDFQL